LANANVGDKPQIEDVDDQDDESDRLGTEGRKLRRMMRKNNREDDNGEEDMYGSSDSVGPPFCSACPTRLHDMRTEC
jgi:hypothetical protein